MKKRKNNQIFMQKFSQNDLNVFKKYLKIREKPGKHEKRLLNIAKKYQGYFRFIPGILGIAIGNSIALNTAHQNSDIDLFIITKKNRIWTVRILTTLLFFLLRRRKNAHFHSEMFCLSFFIDETSLNFEKFAIQNDIYLAYWIENLIILEEKKSIFQKFWNENRWYTFENFTHRRDSFSFGNGNIEDTNSSFFGNIGENILRKIFLPKTQKSFLKKGKPFGVIIDDGILKFHDSDKRKDISAAIFGSRVPQ